MDPRIPLNVTLTDLNTPSCPLFFGLVASRVIHLTPTPGAITITHRRATPCDLLSLFIGTPLSLYFTGRSVAHLSVRRLTPDRQHFCRGVSGSFKKPAWAKYGCTRRNR